MAVGGVRAVRLAILLVLMATAGSLLPIARSADECATAAAEAQVCQRFNVITPQGELSVYRGIYYVFLDGGTCVETVFSLECRAQPYAPGSGIPVGSTTTVPPLGVMALVFQESNHRDGLQRFQASDRVVLG